MGRNLAAGFWLRPVGKEPENVEHWLLTLINHSLFSFIVCHCEYKTNIRFVQRIIIRLPMCSEKKTRALTACLAGTRRNLSNSGRSYAVVNRNHLRTELNTLEFRTYLDEFCCASVRVRSSLQTKKSYEFLRAGN